MNAEKANKNVFSSLEARLSALEPSDVLKARRDRWLLAAVASGLLLVSVSNLWGDGSFRFVSIVGGVVLQLSAMAVLMYRQVRDVIPDFVGAKKKFAGELDLHFESYEEIRIWLRTQPRDVLEKRLAYIESRLEAMGQRYPIAFGAVDRLGVLPVLVGVFLQLQALEDVPLFTGVVGALVIALYCMALWMSRFRLQLHGYARLLKSVV